MASGDAKLSIGMAGRMIATLKNRGEFLALRKCPRYKAAAFILQGCIGMDGEAAGIRVGYTVTKKTGNAVERNRIRRRLREAFRQAATAQTASLNGANARFVLVGHRSALAEPYAQLVAEMTKGIDRLASKSNKASRDSNG